MENRLFQDFKLLKVTERRILADTLNKILQMFHTLNPAR